MPSAWCVNCIRVVAQKFNYATINVNSMYALPLCPLSARLPVCTLLSRLREFYIFISLLFPYLQIYLHFYKNIVHTNMRTYYVYVSAQ